MNRFTKIMVLVGLFGAFQSAMAFDPQEEAICASIKQTFPSLKLAMYEDANGDTVTCAEPDYFITLADGIDTFTIATASKKKKTGTYQKKRNSWGTHWGN